MERDEIVHKQELVEALERILFEFILFTPIDKSLTQRDIIKDIKWIIFRAKEDKKYVN